MGHWEGILEPGTHAGLGATLRTAWVPELGRQQQTLCFSVPVGSGGPSFQLLCGPGP